MRGDYPQRLVDTVVLVVREALADAWDEGYRASERDWNFAFDLTTPDGEREPWTNPYRRLTDMVGGDYCE